MSAYFNHFGSHRAWQAARVAERRRCAQGRNPASVTTGYWASHRTANLYDKWSRCGPQDLARAFVSARRER